MELLNRCRGAAAPVALPLEVDNYYFLAGLRILTG